MSAWTGNEKWYSGATSTLSNGMWSLQIINQGGAYGVYIGRLTGEYKGGGFGFFGSVDGGYDTDTVICLERVNMGVALQKEEGDYCTKLFHAPFHKAVGGTRAYTMP